MMEMMKTNKFYIGVLFIIAFVTFMSVPSIQGATPSAKLYEHHTDSYLDKLPLKKNQDFDKTLEGVVRDAKSGETLPGVNVYVKGTTTGTITDGRGHFSLTVGDDAETLVFSFIGYKTHEVPIDNKTEFNVQLESKVSELNQVVVIGFGRRAQKEVTGSVTTISTEHLKSAPVTNFQSALEGKLAGVQVQTNSGRPGATPQIRIRGVGSITGGSQPLYVINGVPVPNFSKLRIPLKRRRSSFKPHMSGPLSALNSSNIASISVLKGPSATAIFGSRGSNGVVLIKTKHGNKLTDGVQVSLNAYTGVQQATHLPDLMNSEQLIAYTEDARNNYYIQEYYPKDPNSPGYNPQYNPHNNAGRPAVDAALIPDQYINWDGKTNTDWLDLVLSPAMISSFDLSLAGGSENSTYHVSGGYYTQDGTVDGSGFDRYSLNASIQSDVVENWLHIGANIMGSFAKTRRMPANAPYFARPPGIIYSAMVAAPIVKPYYNGKINQLHGQSYLSAKGTAGGTSTASNPLAIIQAITNNIKHQRLFGDVYAELDITNNLYLKTVLGGSINHYNRLFYRNHELLFRTNKTPIPYGQQNASQGISWVSRNTLHYSPTIGQNHQLKILAGFATQKTKVQRSSVFAKHYPDDKVKSVNGGIITAGGGLRSEWSLVSLLGRVNYTYNNKYIVTATIRTDRSSRFGADNQRGVFPSVALGWLISEESFLDSVDFLSLLKLRAGYGVTGNFNIPNYGSYSILGEANYVLGGSEVSGLAPVTLGNPELSWETTKEFDIGLDLGLANGRLKGTFDFYIGNTENLLLNVTVPSALGFQSVLTNIGKVKNVGFELAFTSRNFVRNDFQWVTKLNFSTNRNEVIALGPKNKPIRSAGAAGIRSITRVGDPVGSYYGYVVDGIYQSQQDIANSPKDAQAPDPAPGDFKFKDINGDNKITPADRTVLGSYDPTFTFGVTNRINFKNFDFSVFVEGVKGREILNLTDRHLKNGQANFNSYVIETKRWRSPEDPGNGKIPRADRISAIHGNNNRPSSFQVEDGSYIRIKRVSLGYTLNTLKNLASQIRFYVLVNNLHIFTSYRGFNPEANLQAGNALVRGEDYGAYPLARTFTLGVNIKF